VFKTLNNIPLDALNRKQVSHEHKNVTFTQEASIKTHYFKLKKLIRLVDYQVQSNKLKMIKLSIDSICR
jgi:hypothetical protein